MEIFLKMSEFHVHKEKYNESRVCLEQVLIIQNSLSEDNESDLGLYQNSSFLQSMIRQAKLAPNSLECAAIYNNSGRHLEFDKSIEHAIRGRQGNTN